MEQKFHAVFLCLQHPPERGAADAEPFGGSSLVSIAEGQNMQNDILADLVQGLVQVQGKGRCECR